MSIGQTLRFDFGDSEWIVTKIEEGENIGAKETWTVEVRKARQKELQAIGAVRLFDDAYWANSRLLGIKSVGRQTIRRCIKFLHWEWHEQGLYRR